ncbi:glutathione S-transferase N-terminal domain-containing protein [bacterium]|nr:glutathione S-transferase N-terminal domain-containing protein [bacterium]
MYNLYILKTCPFCKKVIDYMDSKNISYNILDVSEPNNYQSLIDIGGKSQVPFLIDNESGITLYESDDIINYLNEKNPA